MTREIQEKEPLRIKDKPFKVNARFTKYLPHVHFFVDIPFLKVQTTILMYAYERLTYDVVRVGIRAFNKWHFEIDVYYKN